MLAFSVSALSLDLYWRLDAGDDDSFNLAVALVLALVPAQGGAISGYVLARTDTRNEGWLLLPLINVVSAALLGLLPVMPEVTGSCMIDESTAPTRIREFVTGGLLLGSLPLPALAAVYALERRVGRARLHSILDDWDRRRIWLGVFACIAAASWLSAALSGWQSPLAIAGLSLSGLGLAGFWLVEFKVRFRLRRTAASVTKHDGALDAPEAQLLDLGVGSEHWYRATAPAPPYRSLRRPALLILGELSLALRRIDRGLVVDSVALAATLAALALAALQPPRPDILSRFNEVEPPTPAPPPVMTKAESNP